MSSGVKNRAFEKNGESDFQLTDSSETKKPNWFLIIISTGIAGARIIHVNKNLTKLRAFKFQVSKFSIYTWNLNARNFIKFWLTRLILAPAIAVLTMIKNQFGFFLFQVSLWAETTPSVFSKARFLTPDNIGKRN